MRRPGMVIASTIFMLLWASGAAAGGEAPQWMHALTSVPLPAHSNKADAVLLYSETNVTVLSADKIRTHVREAYRILRPGGRELGNVYLWTDSRTKITSLRGWCIPTQGKDYQVTEKDAVDQSPMSVRGYQLMFEDVQRSGSGSPRPIPEILSVMSMK